MFGMGAGRYRQMMDEAAKLPSIEVTREEFIRLSVEAGVPKEKAEFNATIAKGLGSHTRIGDQMVGIKEDEPSAT